jgi:hypothetical protein
MADSIYSWIVGRDQPTNPADIIKAGVERSGMLGWYQEANSVGEKWTRGASDAYQLIGAKRPDSRYISRSILGAILGPTANKVESLVTTGGDLANLHWSAADTRRMRRMLIGQNLFYLRSTFDKLEGGFNREIGVTPYDNGDH